jgi:putative ABC transport system permease protein
VLIVLSQNDPASVNRMTGTIERALAAVNIPEKILIPRTLLEGASDAHVYVFIYSLIFMAVVMAVVGALGLMASMGTSVMERTREIGVMRAVGARSRMILGSVIGEGLFIGLMSWFVAVGLSILPSLIVGNLLGSLFSRTPLALVISPVGLIAWLLIILVGSAAASALPASQASRLTVRETLAYV